MLAVSVTSADSSAREVRPVNLNGLEASQPTCDYAGLGLDVTISSITSRSAVHASAGQDVLPNPDHWRLR
jgi:hypothetical protein